MIRIQADRIRADSMGRFGFGPQEMKKIKVCVRCGTMASSAQLFCRECGEKLPSVTLFQMYKERHCYCPVCDTVVSDQTRYCPQCGSKVMGKQSANVSEDV